MKLWSIILFALLLVSCTDYVNQIEDERDEWRTTREQAALLSSSEIVGLSSSIELKYSSSVVLSGDSHEESSSSVEKSSCSEKLSSSSKDGEPIDVSSSSSVNSKNSSSSAISSSDGSEETSSSSSVILSGDSHEESSSSENVKSSSSGKASWAYLNPAISYGEMIDNRDGQVYKTVVIGGQTWMAENLRYGKKVSNGSEIKDDAIVAYFCYDGDTIKCMKYGGLYSWSEMMALPYNCNNINCSDLIDGDGIHQGNCPQDWHVPSLTEWDVLFTAVGGQSAAGKALKSSENWINNGDGLNTYGFSALPAGYASADGGQYFSEMSEAAFWTANIYSSYQAFYISFGYSGNGSHLTTYRGKVIGQSVRCIKNGSQMSNSSSSVSSSSSKASWTYLNPAISYGEMIDSRDGQVYKTVVIGEQTWMAENLNFRYMGKTLELDSMSFCYDNLVDSCYKYGRLYTWAAVMDSVGLFTAMSKGCGFGKKCASSYNEQGVCPDGWRLPNMDDYETLFDYVGGKDIAGKKLKSLSNGYWLNNGFGDDSYGFSVLPSGTLFTNGMTYGDRRNRSFIWSSSEKDSLFANLVGFNSNFSAVELSSLRKNQAFSVRCLKDDLGNVQNSSSSTIAEESSSSMRIVPPCKTATEDNCEYGELRDNRDGQIYKTVKIGNQWWMAENLNYNMANSLCYFDSVKYCAEWGRLYTWTTALQACPHGSHLPSRIEFETLFEAVGGQTTAGKMLKSVSGWSEKNGIDAYSFMAIPVGYWDGGYGNAYTIFWSSTEYNDISAYYVLLYHTSDIVNVSNPHKTGTFSVRCIID